MLTTGQILTTLGENNIVYCCNVMDIICSHTLFLIRTYVLVPAERLTWTVSKASQDKISWTLNLDAWVSIE